MCNSEPRNLDPDKNFLKMLDMHKMNEDPEVPEPCLQGLVLLIGGSSLPKGGDVRLPDRQVGERVQDAAAVHHQHQDGRPTGRLHRHVPVTVILNRIQSCKS
jgi:hypothetical protein